MYAWACDVERTTTSSGVTPPRSMPVDLQNARGFNTHSYINRHVSEPTIGSKYKRKVSGFSNSGNLKITDDEWESQVIVITDSDTDIDKGESVEFVVKQNDGGHYQALLSHQAPVLKPNYKSSANIPIHHDGKHNQSVGDTRSESHAFRSVDDRS